MKTNENCFDKIARDRRDGRVGVLRYAAQQLRHEEFDDREVYAPEVRIYLELMLRESAEVQS